MVFHHMVRCSFAIPDLWTVVYVFYWLSTVLQWTSSSTRLCTCALISVGHIPRSRVSGSRGLCILDFDLSHFICSTVIVPKYHFWWFWWLLVILLCGHWIQEACYPHSAPWGLFIIKNLLVPHPDTIGLPSCFPHPHPLLQERINPIQKTSSSWIF